MKATAAQKRSLTILKNEGGRAFAKATNIALYGNLIKRGLILAIPGEVATLTQAGEDAIK